MNKKDTLNPIGRPEIYQIEDKQSNASHKYEEKWKKRDDEEDKF